MTEQALTDPQNHLTPEETNSNYDQLSIQRVWLVLVLAILMVLGWVFIAFCEPDSLQTLLFCGLLALFFFETIVAKWYTSSS
jgi:hypothetical protein